jgi:hypothetical protein
MKNPEEIPSKNLPTKIVQKFKKNCGMQPAMAM